MPHDEPRRILVVNANWLGDALFSTPALRALKKHHPRASIVCLGPARIEPVLRRNPHLDGFIVYDDRLTLLNPFALAVLIGRLRAGGFDAAYLFHRSKTKALIARLAGIPERIGYAAPGRSRWLTRAVPPPAASEHKIDHFLGLLAGAGVPADGRHMEFMADLEAQAPLDAKLAKKGVRKGERYVVVHSGGNWKLKRWPAAHFAESARAFARELGLKVVLCGTAAERGLADGIAADAADPGVVSLCGETTFDELALLVKNAEFLLSNDSGPIHLAAAQRTKIIGIFGPTSARLTGPVSQAPLRILSKDAGCAVPCYFQDCSYRVCMDTVKPLEVLGAARELVHA